MKKKEIISVIGLGYVGLPLTIALSKHFKVNGFDLSTERVNQLNSFSDVTNEITSDTLTNSLTNSELVISDSEEILGDSSFYIVTVPTPIDSSKVPNLSPLRAACEVIGKYLKNGDCIVFESTVYPGATEEFCVPILESVSNLRFNIDFFVGYSPERINPGDKEHKLENITKIISGSTKVALDRISNVYSLIIDAGIHAAPSIKVAEAAKVIENIQRDVNIALVNELAVIFNKLGINTNDVLSAANTKWNFLDFKPGLVGGHCIGVDPYYLIHKAHSIGVNPDLIQSSRRINDAMHEFFASGILKKIIELGINVKSCKIAVLGITFKPDCPDIRNTRVINLIQELKEYGCDIDVYDPVADKGAIKNIEKIQFKDFKGVKNLNKYDLIVYAVNHTFFQNLDLSDFKKKIYDVTHSI